MRRVVVFVVVLLFSCFAKAEVKISSFYFNQNGVELTGTSRCLLDELQQYMHTHEVQIIEINAFADLKGEQKENAHLAQQRLDFILNFLAIDDESVMLNSYGSRKVKLNFTPINWHRVDVYYYLGEMKKHFQIEEMALEYEPPIEENVNPEKVNSIVENQPIVLRIKFEGGSYKIETHSYEYLDKLYHALINNTHLNAHVRGHVCCKNNRIKSKKRAKVVYKYLIKRGISKERLSYKGYSNSEPLIFPEVTDEARSANRRVDVVFSRIAD